LIHRCNYILLSQVYCVWKVVKTPTIIWITLYFVVEQQVIFPLWKWFGPQCVMIKFLTIFKRNFVFSQDQSITQYKNIQRY
jgi:hypothetical protein